MPYDSHTATWSPSLHALIATAMIAPLPTLIILAPDYATYANAAAVELLLPHTRVEAGAALAELSSELYALIAPAMEIARIEKHGFVDQCVHFVTSAARPIALRIGFTPLTPDNYGFNGLLVQVSRISRNDAENAFSARENELRYTALTATLPHIVFETNAEGKLLFINRRFTEYSGMSPEEAYAGGWIETVHPDDRAILLTRRTIALQSGEPVMYKIRLRRADGEYRLHLVHTVPQRFDSGTIHRWAGTITDIADQDRYEREQRLLADAGRVLARSLETGATLRNIVQLLVPKFADWCRIDLLEEDGRIRTAAITHRNAEKNAVAQELVGGYQLDPAARTGGAYVIRTGKTELLTDIPQNITVSTVGKASDRDLYGKIGYRSALIVPMQARGATLGAIALVYDESDYRYTSDDIAAVEELGRRAAVAIDNAGLFERQRRVAESFQEASLPLALPSDENLSFDAVYVPGSNESLVGGDWYDAVRLLDGRILISIGDVAGSGLQAAVTMGNIRQIIRGIAQVHADPALMLDAADRALRLDRSDPYATAFVGVYDHIDSTFAYASAGHPPPVLLHSDGSAEFLSDHGLPLGLRNEGEPSTGRILKIDAGTTIVFYTDGLTECLRDPVEGERQVVRIVRSGRLQSAAHPAQALKAALLPESGIHDDIAILIMRTSAVIGAAQNSVDRGTNIQTWKFDSGDSNKARTARREFTAALTARGAAVADVYSAELIFGELLGNVVRYAPGIVDIRVDWGSAAPVLHVLDRGTGFQFLPRLPLDVYSESGRGLFIIAAMTADFHVVKRHDGGSHARAVLRLERNTLV